MRRLAFLIALVTLSLCWSSTAFAWGGTPPHYVADQVGKVQPRKLGATGTANPILNPNWNVSNWFIDPANTTTCASDSNSGQSATCGAAGSGVGPLATWHQLNDVRWGCSGSPRGCPRLTDGNTHTVQFLSSQSGNGDPILLYNTLEAGSSLVIKASLPAAALTSTLTSVGAQWNSSCAIANIRDTVNTIGVIGDLLVDTSSDATGTTSVMWCQEGSTTHICRNSIPMTTAAAIPSSLQTPALWTTATGGANTASGLGNTDPYSLYTALVGVDLVDIQPVIADWSATTPTNGDFLYRINVIDPLGAGKDTVGWGPGVVGYEMSSDRIVNLVGTSSTKDDGCVNCKLNGGLQGGRAATGKYWHMLGGTITSNATICNVTGLGVAIDGFATIFTNCSFPQGVSLGLVDTYPQVGITLSFYGHSELGAISPGYSTVQNGVDLCLQSNTLNLVAGDFAYDSSHSGCGGVMPNTSTQVFQIGGLTTASSQSGSGTVTWTNGLTVSCANLDTGPTTSAFGAYACDTALRCIHKR